MLTIIIRVYFVRQVKLQNGVEGWVNVCVWGWVVGKKGGKGAPGYNYRCTYLPLDELQEFLMFTLEVLVGKLHVIPLRLE